MKRLNVFLLAIIVNFIIIFIFLSANTCSAGTTIDVYAGESIQDAINSANASGGDTVYVHSGNYQLSSTLNIDRPVILNGESSEDVTIEYGSGHTISVDSNNVQISDLTVKNAAGSYQCIILNYASDCLISDNIIEEGVGGVYLKSSNSNTIQDNYFSSNDYGINSYNSDSNTIKSNSFQGNDPYVIFFDSNSNGNTVYKNDFNDMGDGIGGKYASARSLSSNNWDYNSEGNYWDDYDGYDDDPPYGKGDTPYSISGSGGNYDNYPLGDFLTSSQDPVAYIDSITPNPATQGTTVTFNGHGTDDGSIINWEWKSNRDGILSYSKNYQTSTLSVGTHTISYRVLDNEQYWSDYDYKTLVITSPNQKPSAFILEPTTSISKKYGEEIRFLGDGSDDGQIVEYYWRSSIDGFLSGAIQFTRNDLSVGQHKIYLKVKDDNLEWSSESSIDVIILSESQNNAPIAASGGPYSGTTNQGITFDGSDSFDPDDGDNITSYQWDFGDGTTGEGISAEHTYSSEGNFTVNLTVTDSNGEQKTDTTYVNISSQAVAQEENKKKDSPGFEALFLIVAILSFIIYKKKKGK